ncbi:hypothetical protein ACIPSE_02105 [Streptomyces sp. NPDC090106]|uniref:hypothetical protein n=1 Tax=Streptomyces sp. NPDC090106 TaxID=3365946 RepID=UPI0037FC0705
MWRRQQSADGATGGTSGQVNRTPRTAALPPGSAPASPYPLHSFQRGAGNEAASRAVGRARDRGAGAARPRPALPGIDERPETSFVLPPYLMDLQAGGLSSTYGLTGHEFVRHAVSAVVGHADGTVAEIAEQLTGRPESFFGQGRAFAVEGRTGGERYDVTVTVSRAPDDRPPVFRPAELLGTPVAGEDGVPQALLEDPRGKDTKLDVHHNSAATVSSSGGGSAGHGVGGLAFGLAPVAPGLWLGAAATVNAQPWQSSRESRRQTNIAEPRVLRSDKGSVEARRRVRYEVRVRRAGTDGAQTFQDTGTLTQRVPTEHLVPAGTVAPAAPAPLSADTARGVSLADSLAPVAVTDTAAPHQGGRGLFDAVASVLHPSITAPGAPGRGRLYDVTSTSTVLEDLPRLLRDGVNGEDLYSKDGRTAGSYRLRAAVTGLSPAWGTGKTQLRTHQHGQSAVTDSAGKGRAVQAGLGPAAGVGAAGNAAVVRATAMPVAAARKARFTVAEQSVAGRQGAEVRGEKALYFGTVTFTAEGTGPRSAQAILRPGTRVAVHTMNVWVSLRADEARSLGLPLPPALAADGVGDFVRKPKRTDDNGDEQDVERHLPFADGRGTSVALSRVDTGPMVRAVLRMFAGDPRLAGYLPAFGTAAPDPATSAEEAETQRANHRELMTALSETNIRVNKDQLLSGGLRVRLRRKTAMHSHDVQILVRGRIGDTAYEGDIKDWSVRSHQTVGANAQSGRASSRSIGGLVLGQARLVPGVLTAGARYERHATGSYRNQAGTTGRTDVVANGSDTASAFRAALQLDVEATMTSRPRKLARGLTIGAPGRDVPEAETLTYTNLGTQDVRLLTPAEFTLDDAGRDRADAARAAHVDPAPATDVAAGGIGDLSSLTLTPAAGPLLRDWQLVETVDGAPVRALALALLARAAGRNRRLREDPALATEGLAPRLAVEERFGERAVQAALRQAASSGWIVKNLRHPRRLAALDGAVGTRLALANPRFVHTAQGPGTETFVLGGHQSSGQAGRGTSSTVQVGASVAENGTMWRAGQGVSASRTTSAGDARSYALSGTVERNTHTPKKSPLHLVRCDVLVTMIAEVKVTGGGPYVAAGTQTLPAAAGVWLTDAQLPPVLRRQLGLDPALPDPAAAEGDSDTDSFRTAAESTSGFTDDSDTESETASFRTAPEAPALRRELPLGFGTVEDLPDFVPLLARLRTGLARGDRRNLADTLLPHRQLDDRNDNVQRLLRVLDRDGSAGLLSGAMDGGVTVELYDGRNTPCWAVFRIDRTGDGTFAGDTDDRRDMEYITSAVAQHATSHDEGSAGGVEAVLAGSGKPDGGSGQLKSTGAAAGLGLGSSTSRRTGAVGRGQIGMKTVADAGSAAVARMRVPIRASLELFRGGTRVAEASLEGLTLTHRVLRNDLAALDRAELPLQDVPLVARGTRSAPSDLGAWRASGARLPMEAQVNGFQGVPQVRQLLTSTVREAGGGARFRDKGQAAAYALNEAVSTEWMIAALPLLTSSGVDLPPVHASGARGQNLHASLHGRLRNGRVLGVGDKMAFETIGQSHLDGMRPTQHDGQSSADHNRSARALAGAGVLNADQFRLNQLLANSGGAGGTTDATANASGSLPVHKPKAKSVLIQFTLDLRTTARIDDGPATTRETTLSRPVVLRLPEPEARALVTTQNATVRDDDDHLGLRP